MSFDFEQRVKNMKDVKDVFEPLDISLWLERGTVLGHYRDGDFISWDNDVDFLVFSEVVYPKLSKIEKNLIKLGFNVKIKKQRKYGSRGGSKDGKDRLKISASRQEDVVNISSYFLNKVLDLRVRIPYRFPSRLFNDNGFINVRGIQFSCPEPIEEYLELIYGDWKTPVKTLRSANYHRGKGTTKHNKIDIEYKKLCKKGIYKYLNTESYNGYQILEGE